MHILGYNLIILMNINLDYINFGFSDIINPMFACGTEVETTEHFLLGFQFYSTQRLELFENLEKVEPNFLRLSVKNQVLILLYGSQASNSKSLNQKFSKM